MKTPDRPPRPESPLGAWLRETGRKQIDFRREWYAVTGIPLAPQVVSRWARGDATPIPHHRLIIARITLGAVPVEAWADHRTSHDDGGRAAIQKNIDSPKSARVAHG